MFIVIATWILICLLGIVMLALLLAGFIEGWDGKDIASFLIHATNFSVLLYYALR